MDKGAFGHQRRESMWMQCITGDTENAAYWFYHKSPIPSTRFVTSFKEVNLFVDATRACNLSKYQHDFVQTGACVDNSHMTQESMACNLENGSRCTKGIIHLAYGSRRTSDDGANHTTPDLKYLEAKPDCAKRSISSINDKFKTLSSIDRTFNVDSFPSVHPMSTY